MKTETGGREITGYYIERREIGSDWIRVNNYPCPTLNYTVPGLRDGGRYEFRVIACNEAGPGQPSKPSVPITAGKEKAKKSWHSKSNLICCFPETLTSDFTYAIITWVADLQLHPRTDSAQIAKY